MINALKQLSKRKLLFLLLFMMALSVGKINAQLVTNGSFEKSPLGPATQVEGWVIQVEASLSVAPEIEIVDDPVQHGNRALKVKVNSIGANAWDIQVVGDSIPVRPGGRYRYSVWAKAENPGAQANFTIGNYSYNEYGAIRPGNISATSWTQFTMEFTITDQRTVARAPIHFNIAANVGNTIYIDNLQVIDLDAPDESAIPVIVEAESGTLGADFEIKQDGDITYVAIKTNTVNSGNPGGAARVITYDVTFPSAGTYDLFVRLRVGSNTFNDDSFFYGNGFGEKDPLVDTDWIMINGLAAGGFSGENDIVSDPGGLGSNVWKWVNVSKNSYQSGLAITFDVEEDGATYKFQIGGREDGLDIDKLAFGKSDLYYTVKNLDNGEPGSEDLPGEIWSGPPLAHKQQKFLGSAHSNIQAINFASYWNKVTPENAGKWGSVEGTRNQMNWGALDAAYNLAKDNNFPFHFHVLIWGAQQPSWINNLSPEEQLAEIREWFEAVAARYPDIDYLEVVNEALPNHNPPDGASGRANYKNALGGNGVTGYDWVINSFRMAREIFPATTKLMLNDYSIINSSSSTAEYLKIIRLLQKENLIDIIGEQGHAFTTANAAVTTMRRNLDSLASTGLPIHITELDIDGPTDQAQLNEYRRVFPLLWEHPAIEGITLWGWRPGLWRNDQKAYLVESNGAERPALVWLRNYLDTVVVSVDDDKFATLPNSYQLYNNYPNPFNPTTNISYYIPEAAKVTLDIYDVLGRHVQSLVNDLQPAGKYTVTFNARNLSSGIYFYRISAGSFSEVKRMLLMK